MPIGRIGAGKLSGLTAASFSSLERHTRQALEKKTNFLYTKRYVESRYPDCRR